MYISNVSKGVLNLSGIIIFSTSNYYILQKVTKKQKINKL